MKCKVLSRDWLNDVEFYFYKEREHEIVIANPIDLLFTVHEQGAAVDRKKATFTLPYNEAIELIESLLSEAHLAMLGSAKRMRKDDLLEGGELRATKSHLEDMRKMAMKAFESLLIPTAPQIILDDGVRVSKDRIKRAAKKCPTAKNILIEIFPEVFGPGWEQEYEVG